MCPPSAVTDPRSKSDRSTENQIPSADNLLHH